MTGPMLYSMNCDKRPSSSIIMASDSLSRAAGRGSGRGGLALACSAGDNVALKGDRGVLDGEADGTADGPGCTRVCDMSIGETGIAGCEFAVKGGPEAVGGWKRKG